MQNQKKEKTEKQEVSKGKTLLPLVSHYGIDLASSKL